MNGIPDIIKTILGNKDIRVIISFTTIPSRISEIERMIDSICNQTLKPESILLWIPKTYKRIQQEVVVPDFIKNSPIEIKLCDDVGPFTKLYYTLKQEWENKECIIVTVDDDVYYPPEFLKNLIKYVRKYPDQAIGYRGRVLKDKLNYSTSKKYFGSPKRKPLKVDIITGTWGAAYRVKFFDDHIFNDEIINSNFMVDDIWITGNLAKNNVGRIILKNIGIKLISEIHEIDPLWKINRETDNNNKLLEYFKGYI
ncbi:MAG: glycosyltransferase family A protein [Aquaticitalea sp.]